MAQVRWTPQALDDLEAIRLFIARDAPPVASVFAQRTFDATDKLAEFRSLVGSYRNWMTRNLEKSFSATTGSFTEFAQAMLKFSTVHHGARLLEVARFASGT